MEGSDAGGGRIVAQGAVAMVFAVPIEPAANFAR